MAASIAVLNYFAFFVLYIIGFVFIYQKFSEIIGFSLLIVVNLAFFFYAVNDLMKMFESALNFVTFVSIFAVISGTVLHSVLLIFILMVITNLKGKFEKAAGAPINLPKQYADMLETIKRLMIASFCLGFCILYNLFYYRKLLEINFTMLMTYIDFKSPVDNTLTRHLTLFFTLAASLALMGISGKQVFDGRYLSRLSRQELMIPTDSSNQ
jgi:hypothetical protein